MFSDSDTTCIGFASCCELKRESEDVSVQTSEVRADNKEVQAKEHIEVGIQAQEEEFGCKPPQYDEGKLAEFLSRICPAVVKELDRVSRSNAFAAYSLAEEEEEVLSVAVLQPTETVGESDGKRAKVSELSWSCTGSVLAVASSHSLHTSWCSHQGSVRLYNVDRGNKSPSQTLDTASCIRSVSMHPYLASVVAAGTMSGEVLVWDTASEGSGLVNTQHATHGDAVTRVRWVLGSGTNVTLASASLDGHLFLWKVSPQLGSFQVLERYKCEVGSAEPGVTSFAFPRHQQDRFVVALEGGALLHCSILTARPITSVRGSEPVKDPTVSYFETQPATVTCMEFSPHADDVFATASTDNAIRVFNLHQGCVQNVMWGSGGLIGLSWSPAQAHVLACWGHSDTVSLYNSLTAETLPALSPGEDEPNKTCLSAVAFNSKSPCLLAVGDLDGVSQVWKVPTHFCTKPKQ